MIRPLFVHHLNMPAADPSPSPTMSPSTPVAAQFVVTFLKPEMLHIYRQICSLRAFRPVVLCQKREGAEVFPFPDVQIVRKARTHALRRLWQKQILGRPITIYRSEADRLRATLESIQAGVLHIYFGHIGVHLLPLLENCPLPTIVSFHGADAGVGLDKPSHLEPTRRMVEMATLLLVRSESLAERLVALGADRGNIRLHRTGIPLSEIPFVSRTDPPNGAWRCVQACRLIPKKGLATSLRAFAEFRRLYPGAIFTIAGEGPQLPELKALVSTLSLAEHVHFVGFLSQEQLRTLYAESHFFLHPSEMGADGDQEGVPNAMLEAMATGLPALATTHGGIPEAVVHGVSGLLSAEHDFNGLAKSLISLARDPEGYLRMSVAAATRVASAFDLTVQSRALEGFYREAIARFTPRQKTS